MELKEIAVRAQIRLLSTEQGGRSQDVNGPCSYRPNHNFWGDDIQAKGFAAGVINLPSGKNLLLGETTEVEVIFFAWPELYPELYLGREWRIQEGAKLVGHGRILEILP